MFIRVKRRFIPCAILSALIIFIFSSLVFSADTKLAHIFKVPGPVIIDGKLDDWKLDDQKCVTVNDPKFLVDGADKWKGPSDLSGKVHFMWDATHLYVAAIVSDNEPMINPYEKAYIFQGDSVEVYFGKTNSKKPFFTKDDYQFGLSTGQDGKGAIIWIWDNGMTGSNRKAEARDSHMAVLKTNSGYIIEAKVAWSNFEGFTPKVGDKVGLDVNLNDLDKSPNDYKAMTWIGDGDNWQKPSNWGEGLIAD